MLVFISVNLYVPTVFTICTIHAVVTVIAIHATATGLVRQINQGVLTDRQIQFQVDFPDNNPVEYMQCFQTGKYPFNSCHS